ncbi:MAG TPA: amino acid ABC transporter permease [Trueperaceae bacterium]|nr:amino acid ABC transporter permease [Trueperaceae bacterium]
MGETGAVAWARRNLFGSVADSIATVVGGTVLLLAAFGLLQWIFTGAHWEQVWNNLKLFAVYRYPRELLWRPFAIIGMIMFLLGLSASGSRSDANVIIRGVFWWFFFGVGVLGVVGLLYWPSVRFGWAATAVAGLVGLAIGAAVPAVKRSLGWLWGASVVVAFVLLYGVFEGGPLRHVETRVWGGFLLTMVLSVVGIVVSFPLGILLALGRRSKLPAIKWASTAFIEVVRGAPLITWLFIASLLVPLLLGISDPDRISALTRALVAVTLFSAAYMAENVRGGLQAVPKGQEEAARALGLSGWQTTLLIVLPQALRAVIPAIVGQAIGLFKDTSLVFIVGLFDFFNIAGVVATQPASLLVPGGIRLELSLLLVVVYWFFAYRMSVASRQLEAQLGVGTR